MICIVACGSNKVPQIESMVAKAGHDTQIIALNDIAITDLASFDAFILSGAPILLSQVGFSDYADAINMIIKQNKPTLGICFGHQAIAMHFGALVFMSNECRTDEIIHIQSSSILFESLVNPVVFNQDHCEEASVPAEFIHLASSATCQNEAMQHSSLPIYGIQFHPETSGDNGQVLFNNFLASI